MRSKLFVPGARPDLFDKALASGADALSFDLEDSVPAEGKEAARERLAQFLRSDAARASGKRLIVRVNGLGTPFLTGDIAALADSAAQMVNLPKVEAPEDVQAAVEGTSLPILANIETPRGLRQAAQIAAHPRVLGLQVGLNDLFAPLGIERGERANVHAALWQVRFAAAEAGRFAYDGAWPDLDDSAGFEAEAILARSLGFIGKTCIHPRQVPIANAVFAAPDMLDEARSLLAAAETAAARGHGAFAFRGRMIDRPAIEQARAMLAATGIHRP
jgi:citrate lyase subunit beta / citryl-CoA lyase